MLPEFGQTITYTPFPKTSFAGPETLADPGPNIPAEPVFRLPVVPFLILFLGQSSQAGCTKRNGL